MAARKRQRALDPDEYFDNFESEEDLDSDSDSEFENIINPSESDSVVSSDSEVDIDQPSTSRGRGRCRTRGRGSRNRHATPRTRGGRGARGGFGINVPDDWVDDDEEPKVFDFTANAGIKHNIPAGANPLDYFKLFIDDEIVQQIVTETNKYAVHLKNNDNSANSRLKHWKDTNSKEITEFLSLLMLMGHMKKPTIEEYWSTNPMLSTPFFGQVMSYNRFCLLLRCFHLCDNTMQPPGDRLYKIRHIIQLLVGKFQQVYIPDENISIDESLMLWKGRLIFKQYIPSKRARYGIKLFLLCESSTGYVWCFFVYTGKDTELQGEGPCGQRVVMTLLEKLKDKGYKLFLDRWFTSISLAEELMKVKTNVAGTIKRKSKNLPKVLTGKKCLNHLNLKSRRRNDVRVFGWKDKRDVFLISTMHKEEMAETAKRDRVTKEPILKPKVIVDYNAHMGGVDRCDALLHSYQSMRKTMKWYKKLFLHLVDIAIFNAHVLYNKQNVNMSLEKFRLGVIEEILKTHHVERPRSSGGRPSTDNPLRLTERHFISYTPPTKARPHASRVCHVCAHTALGPKVRKETSYMCEECNKPLCAAPCFKNYHTKMVY